MKDIEFQSETGQNPLKEKAQPIQNAIISAFATSSPPQRMNPADEKLVEAELQRPLPASSRI